MEIFKVFTLDWVQQRRTFTFLLLIVIFMEIFKGFHTGQVQQRRMLAFQFPAVCRMTRTCLALLSGCISVTATRARPTTGTDALKRLSGSRRAQGERCTTGTRIPAPAVLLSLLCLRGDAVRGEGLGIHPFLGATPRAPCLWQSVRCRGDV